MTTLKAPVFAEMNFEVLASALDAVPAPKRELFLTKLVILLISSANESLSLEMLIERAKKNL